MKTIKKILWYTPLTHEQIDFLQKAGLFNGTWADGVFFDDLIDKAFEILWDLEIFDDWKGIDLRRDINQLVVRHDIDIGFRIGFFRANWRLAYGLYKLLHHFGFKIQFTIWAMVFYAVHFTSKARNNYNKLWTTTKTK